MADHKRTADDAGLEVSPDGAPEVKTARFEDELAALDSPVRAKVNQFFERGLVKPEEMDSKALKDLGSFPTKSALEILDQFEKAELSAVRNKSAYLCGVMTRYKRQPPPPSLQGPKLHPDVQLHLENVVRMKNVKLGDLDARCYETLNSLAVPQAIRAIDRLAARDLSDVRNLSAFFMSHVKSVQMEGDMPPPGHMGFRPQGGPPPQFMAPPPHVPPPFYGSPFDAPMPPQPYMMPPGQPGMPPAPYPGMPPHQAPPPVAALSAPAGYGMPSNPVPENMAGRPNYGMDQRQAGVRVEEFHGLSVFAPFVHPACALRLQTIWDSGVRLVSLLDDRAWEVLAQVGPTEGLSVIDETADGMNRPGGLRNVNAFFMSCAKKFQGGAHAGGPPAGGYGGAPFNPYGSAPAPRGEARAFTGRGAGSALHTAPPTIQAKAQEVIAGSRGLLKEDHFDEGVCAALNRMPEAAALDVLNELQHNEMESVRNVPAYIMGICKRRR